MSKEEEIQELRADIKEAIRIIKLLHPYDETKEAACQICEFLDKFEEDGDYLSKRAKEFKKQRDALAEQVKGNNSFCVPLNCDQNRCHLCRGSGFIDDPKNEIPCYECEGKD